MYESWQVSSHKSVKPTLLFGSVQKVDLASCIQASSTPLIGQWGYVSFWRMPRWPDVPGQIEVKQSAAESGSTLHLLAILWGPSILASWIKYLTCVCVWMCSRPRYVCVPACVLVHHLDMVLGSLHFYAAYLYDDEYVWSEYLSMMLFCGVWILMYCVY